MQHHLQSHTWPARPAQSAVPHRLHSSHRSVQRGQMAHACGSHSTTFLPNPISEPAGISILFQQLTNLAAATALSIGLIAQPCMADELSFAFPASANPEIREAQKTLVESWAYVDTLYVDGTDHSTWAKALQDALAASFKAKSASEVTQITRELLAQLDDPYTRLLQQEEEEALAAEEEGKIVATGLGLQQLTVASGPVAAAAPAAAAAADDSTNGAQNLQQQQQEQVLVVSFVIDGSPAAQAGVQEGDAVLDVAGQSVAGKSLRDVYKLLAKEADVTLARQPPFTGSNNNTAGSNDSTAGSAAVTDNSSNSSSSSASKGLAVLSGVERYTVSLKPQPLKFEAAQYGIVDLSKDKTDSSTGNISSTLGDGTLDSAALKNVSSSSSSSSSNGSDSSSSSSKVGYLKVLTFSATAPQAVAEALVDMQREGAQEPGGLAGLIVDLRDNPGGIVEAGVDIAQDFLQAGQVLCIAMDKTAQEERVVLPEAHTLTDLPLVVLVNHSTASTSELLAGALHDELRAPLIGTTTYGKGRTQRVIRLADGKSTLLVSTLKYLTPAHTAIDNVGLAPDIVCEPEAVLAQPWQGGKQEAGSLLDDPCIKLAAERLVGVM